MLDENTPFPRRRNKVIEDSAVEARVIVPDEGWYLKIDWNRMGGIVRTLDAAMRCKQKDEHLLRTVSIDGAEAKRNHELRRLVIDLEWPKERDPNWMGS